MQTLDAKIATSVCVIHFFFVTLHPQKRSVSMSS